MVDGTVTYLEMTSAGQLVPGRTPPVPIELQEVGRAAAPLIRSTYTRIGAPFGWTGRTAWSDAQWEEELSRPSVHVWIAQVDRQIAGVLELEARANGDVGIVVFGLVPELVGRGFGGAFLTLATTLAWNVAPAEGRSTKRVWLQTSSRDHPNARPNYERRGFRVFEPSNA